MYEITIEKTKSIQLPELIETVVNGEEVVFTQDDLPIAKLIAIKQEKPRPQFGSAKGSFTLAKDFDEPLKDFDEYCQ